MNKKTVLITGSSSGIGKAAAVHFAKKGWNVVATMRHPEKRGVDFCGQDVLQMHLDVQDPASIRKAVLATEKKFGPIDVLVNNAGYAVRGVFEASTDDEVKKQYDTNVFGLFAVCREIIPLFRKRKNGTIINVASIGGKVAFPLYSLYNSTKFAVEGFSEALHYELRPFHVRVKVIEPGIIKTDFYDRSMVLSKKKGLTAYDSFQERSVRKMAAFDRSASGPEVIAKLIYRAATDGKNRLRYFAGNSARLMVTLRKVLPDALLFPAIRAFCG